MWIKHRSGFDSSKSKYLKEYFSNLKDTKLSRLYPLLLLLRRTLLVSYLIAYKDQDSDIQLGVFLGLQIIYSAFIILIRPFKFLKCNIIEIMNESTVLVVLGMPLILHSSNNWNQTFETVYSTVILSNFVLISGILVTSLTVTLISKLRNLKRVKVDRKLPMTSNVVTETVPEIPQVSHSFTQDPSALNFMR